MLINRTLYMVDWYYVMDTDEQLMREVVELNRKNQWNPPKKPKYILATTYTEAFEIVRKYEDRFIKIGNLEKVKEVATHYFEVADVK